MKLTARTYWTALAGASALLAVASIVMTEWFKLSPCYLCIFQRLLFMVLAGLAVIAVLAPLRSLLRRLTGVVFGAGCALGIGVAGYQSWLQAQEAGTVSCVGGDPSLIERIVDWLGERIPDLFLVTGYCEDKELVILGLSLANWALVAFTVFLLASIWALWHDRPREP